MNPRLTLLTAGRVLRQIRGDHRTVALMLVVPCVLIGLLAWVFTDRPMIFDTIGPALLGVFPFVVMFIVTSIATLRERTGGTLERLLTTPLSRWNLLASYGLVFGVLGYLFKKLKYPLALTSSTSHIRLTGQTLPLIFRIQAYFAAHPAQSTPRLFLRCRAPSSAGRSRPSSARSPFALA